jgi:hypothetical protein
MKKFKRTSLYFGLTILCHAWAQTPAGASESVSCKALITALRAARLQEAVQGNNSGLQEEKVQLAQAHKTLCPEFQPEPGSTVYYPNGKVATYSAATKGATWYFPNSKVITYSANDTGATFYYPSAKVFSYSHGEPGSTVYYPNSKVVTYSLQTVGSTWYFSNGKVITYSAGDSSATWYYASGKVISYSLGQGGSTWYYENGSVLYQNGPTLSSDELLDVLGVLSKL